MTLTVSQLREHILDTPLGDDALQRVLDAAYAWIDSRIGPSGSRTELAYGGFPSITLSRQADTFTSVTETTWSTTTTLGATDYRLRPDGYTLDRLTTGTYPRSRWWGTVEIVYTPVDDSDLRDDVARELCRLALNSNPGVQMEQIGSWMQQMASNSAWNATEEWASILGRLDPSPGILVVGQRSWTW